MAAGNVMLKMLGLFRDLLGVGMGSDAFCRCSKYC